MTSEINSEQKNKNKHIKNSDVMRSMIFNKIETKPKHIKCKKMSFHSYLDSTSNSMVSNFFSDVPSGCALAGVCPINFPLRF